MEAIKANPKLSVLAACKLYEALRKQSGISYTAYYA